MVLLHTICQNSSGAVMTPTFGPVQAAIWSFHVLGFIQLTKQPFHRRATCLECTSIWHQTDLISHRLPQETQDTLFQSHLIHILVFSMSVFMCILLTLYSAAPLSPLMMMMMMMMITVSANDSTCIQLPATTTINSQETVPICVLSGQSIAAPAALSRDVWRQTWLSCRARVSLGLMTQTAFMWTSLSQEKTYCQHNEQWVDAATFVDSNRNKHSDCLIRTTNISYHLMNSDQMFSRTVLMKKYTFRICSWSFIRPQLFAADWAHCTFARRAFSAAAASGWLIDVESFTGRLSAWSSCRPRHFQATLKDVYVCFVLTHKAHFRFYVYALYEFTLTLTLTFSRQPKLTKTTIMPMLKNKAGSPIDVNNYRAIALSNSLSKVLKNVILSCFEMCDQSNDLYQFRFKKTFYYLGMFST